MSDVGVVFKIYPEEGRLDEVVAGLRKLGPQDLRTEELAFGMQAILAMFVYDNAKSNSTEIEERIRKVDGVSEIEVEQETLI